GELPDANGLFPQRTATLRKELERLAADANRPSTALQARTLGVFMQIDPRDLSRSQSFFAELREIVLASEGMVGYPLASLIEILTAWAEVISDLPAFDELFETVVD